MMLYYSNASKSEKRFITSDTDALRILSGPKLLIKGSIQRLSSFHSLFVVGSDLNY